MIIEKEGIGRNNKLSLPLTMPTNKDLFNHSHKKLKFIADSGLAKFEQAKVLVVGAGGLGCPCLLALSGCGIGEIGIADHDTVSLTNLHRQNLYQYSDINKPKVTLAIEALKNRNPFISFSEHQTYVDIKNIISLVNQYDIIVDATDNFQVRYLINDACVALDKPLVYGAIYQDEGQVTVFNYQKSPTLRCLFPEAEDNLNIPSCADIGAYTITTNIIGTMMANEVVKVILGSRDVLKGKLLYFDVLAGKTRIVNYSENHESRKKSRSRFENPEEPIEITPEIYLQKAEGRSVQVIDVREDEERENFDIGGLHLPLQDLMMMNLNNFSNSVEYLFYCQSGIRSFKAAEFFRKKGLKHSFSLQGGLNNLKKS